MTKISFISAGTVRAIPTVRHLLKLFTKEPSIKSVALYDVDSLESHAVALEPSIVHQAIGQVKNAGAISDKSILRWLRKYFKILLILNRIRRSRDRNIEMGVLVDFRDPQMFINTVHQIIESNSGTCNREHIKTELKNRLHSSIFLNS